MIEESKSLPKVVYIMGTGRSGTTILEILLSHGENTFGAGEISSLVHDGFIDNKLCSCQHVFDNCMVWGKVKKELNFKNGQLEQWRNIQKKLDWHDGFLRQLAGLIKDDESQLYNAYNAELLTSIKNISGAGVVIDSSKYAGRAYALSRIPGVNLKIICLTRSPAGLMSSFQKKNKEEQKPKSAFSSLIYYSYTTLTLKIIGLLLKNKIIFVEYENLIKTPIKFIKNIETFVNIDFSETKNRLEEKQSFNVGHIVTGNRLRKNKKIHFDPKDAILYQFNYPQKIAVSLMTLWKWIIRL